MRAAQQLLLLLLQRHPAPPRHGCAGFGHGKAEGMSTGQGCSGLQDMLFGPSRAVVPCWERHAGQLMQDWLLTSSPGRRTGCWTRRPSGRHQSWLGP